MKSRTITFEGWNVWLTFALTPAAPPQPMPMPTR